MKKKNTPEQRIKALTSVSVAQLNCIVEYLEDVLDLSIYGGARDPKTGRLSDGLMDYSLKDIKRLRTHLLRKAQEEAKKKRNEK